MTSAQKLKGISFVKLFLLSIVTVGIYAVYWFILVKRSLVEKGEIHLPTSWLIIVPIANVYLAWKVFESLEKVSKGKLNALMIMLISLAFFPVAVIIVHDWFLNEG